MEKSIKMKEGQKLNRNPNNPVITIVGKGSNTYLWVGNDVAGDKACFATVSGMKTLEKIACTILRQLGHSPTSIKKSIKKRIIP